MAINKLDTGAIQDNAITNAKMADDAVGVADLAATGTPSSTTFLRGDNSWATAGSTSASDLTSGTLPDARFPSTLPAISGANLTGVGVDGITSSADATAITIDSSENVGIGVTPLHKLHVKVICDLTVIFMVSLTILQN